MRHAASMLSILLLAAGSAYAGGGGKLPMGKDYEEGLARAKAEGKPLVLYFTADW